MPSPDDTFNKLRRIPISEMIDKIKIFYDTLHRPAGFTQYQQERVGILEQHGWNEKDFSSEADWYFRQLADKVYGKENGI